MEIERLSLTTTPINLYKDDKIIQQGTGFYVIRLSGGKVTLFLVSNYHVFTHTLPMENKMPEGTKIEFQIHSDQDAIGRIKNISLPLFSKSGKPIWITNSRVPEADLAVIPLPVNLYRNCLISGITEEMAKNKLKIRPASNVSLIGYPYGFYDKKNALPIWKTGSIASEPECDFNGRPLFLVDVSAFPGMSGAPVFSVGNGSFETEAGATESGNIRKFLGIYSSMQMLNREFKLEQGDEGMPLSVINEISLQLGHIWRAELIFEIINNTDLDKYKDDLCY